MEISEQKLILLSTLIQLEHKARNSENLQELGFIITNESLNLVNYRQAVLWSTGHGPGIKINAVSGVDKPDSNSPFIIFLKGLTGHLLKDQPDNHSIKNIDKESLPERYKKEWDDFSMGHAVWCPLLSPGREMLGGLILFRKESFEEGEFALLERLIGAYGHAWWAIKKRKDTVFSSFFPNIRKMKGVKLSLMLASVFLLFLPVRLSVLAPAEIVPRDPFIVSVPMDGVISSFIVEPNQMVKPEQLLFSLDDTGVRNEYELAVKTLDIAKEEYNRAAQKGFSDEKSRGDLLLLEAQISQRTAYVNYMAEILKRSRIKAETKGIIVFNDVQDWIGKPVIVGEKIAAIADPEHVESEIMLPVEDAINLKEGADILIFLNVAPEKPISAVLRKAGYEAVLTPDGVLAFQIKAELKGNKAPRIGLRGTAKIYGEKVSLAYYLFRRPLIVIRQFFGI